MVSLFEKNVGMLDFVIKKSYNINLTNFIAYNHHINAGQALRYSIVFLEETICN